MLLFANVEIHLSAFSLQDGDIINIDVTVYLNVSTFLSLSGFLMEVFHISCLITYSKMIFLCFEHRRLMYVCFGQGG